MPIQKSFIRRHAISLAVLIVLLAGGGWLYVAKGSASKKGAKYVLAAAVQGSVAVSVSGSGQVSTSNQVDIKPKISGTMISIRVKKGDMVKEGAILLELDTRDARKAVRDAEENLRSAQLSLEKIKKPIERLSLLQAENALSQAKRELEGLQEPPDGLSILQAENTLEQSKESNEKAESALKKEYDDGFNSVQMPSLICQR